MKILSCIFVLAVLSSPLFGTEYLHDDTIAAFIAADENANGYIALLFAAWGGDDTNGAGDGSATVALDEDDFKTASNLSAAVLLEIVMEDPGNTATTLAGTLEDLDEAIVDVGACYTAAASDTDCLCGTEGAVANWNTYVAGNGGSGCSAEITEADVILINTWLDAAKLTGATGAKLPGFLNADLTALSTGAWTTVSCYATAEAAAAGTGFTGCANEYGLLRGLWDSADVPAATLTAGGLDATVIPDLLFAYELNDDSDVWDDFATYFIDGEEFVADETFTLEDLQDVFCDSDGVPVDAVDVVTNAADFGGAGQPFDVLFLEVFLKNIKGWDSDEGELTVDDELSNYNWLTAICPGDGSGQAAIVDLWAALLKDLVVMDDEGTYFALVADCNPDFVEGTASTTIVHDEFDVACLPCPVAGADGVVEQSDEDSAEGRVRVEGFDCLTPPPPTKEPEPVKDDPETECDETEKDPNADLFCEVETDDAARGFAACVSLLAIMLSLWK